MNDQSLKLVLFASSSLAIPALNQLIKNQWLVGVVISERMDSDAQQLAFQLEQAKIPYIRFQQKSPEQTLFQLETWHANSGVIFTFSHKLPAEIVKAFNLGLYNLHASNLPAYRGAMPLYWQIRNQEQHASLSMMKATELLDSGDIMLQQSIPLHPLDTLNSFANTVASYSAEFVDDFFGQLAQGDLVPQAQVGEISHAPMPTQQDLIVDFTTMKASNIAAMARAGNPTFNGARLVWNGASLDLLQATCVERERFGVAPGTVLYIGEPEGLIVATIDGALRLDIINIAEGVFTGLAFAERFGLDAGMKFG